MFFDLENKMVKEMGGFAKASPAIKRLITTF
jgi:hypothetical protein